MKKLLALSALCLAAAAAAAAAATAPVVPLRSQQAIQKRIPRYAYVPARVPTGFRYYRWATTQTPQALSIWFRDRARREITFVAAARTRPCEAGKEKTFQLDGVKVYWGHTATEQEAWRCIGDVRLTAATPLPPTRFSDSGLGRVAASGHRIR